MPLRPFFLPAAAMLATVGCAGTGSTGHPQTAAPPAPDDRTIVLFDGSSWDGWIQRDGSPSGWIVQDDGSVMVSGGDAVTRRSFGDFQLHLEFLCPVMDHAEGQARANSGVYLHGRYEVQVLDSFGDEPAGNGCGAVYSIAPPLANASLPPGQWQTYDIAFRTPRYGPADDLLEPARVTVLHNGIVIHNNLELPGPTPGGIEDGSETMGPILLQDHGDPVRYRNIWIREERGAGAQGRRDEGTEWPLGGHAVWKIAGSKASSCAPAPLRPCAPAPTPCPS